MKTKKSTNWLQATWPILTVALILAVTIFVVRPVSVQAEVDPETCGHVWEVDNDNGTFVTYICSNCGTSFSLYYVSGDDGVTITACGDNDTILDIPGTINGQSVKLINNYAFRYSANLKSVILPDGVTQIGQYAFMECTNLTSITIPESVTDIGICAFSGCSSLTEINIPQSVTTIEDYVFSDCSSLAGITISDSVTSIGEGAFSRCSSMTSITIPVSVTEIYGSAFSSECTVFYEGTICQWEKTLQDSCNFEDRIVALGGTEHSFDDGAVDTENQTFTYTCSGCGKYYSLDYTIENNECAVDLESTDLNETFPVIIPSEINHVPVVSITEAQDGSIKLRMSEVSIPDSVTTIDYRAFYNCTALTSVTIPDGVTSIGGDAFYNCTALTSVTIPDSVTTIWYRAFYNCTALTSVTIPDGVTMIDEQAFRNCTSLKSITMAGSVADIGDYCFRNCTALESVTIQDGVTMIGYGEFEDCTNLTSITIPDSVTVIRDHAFKGCASLPEVRIPQRVTSLGIAAFADCSSMKSITVPKSVADIYENSFGTSTNPVYYGYDTIEDFVVYGYKNSAADTYAEENNLIFVPLDMESERISGDTRYDTALESAEALKAVLNVDQFDCIVVASGVNFPDALAGSSLAAMYDAPILLVGSNDNNAGQKAGTDKAVAYIRDNLASGGRIYILGGTSAVSANTEAALQTIAGKNNVKRLSGSDRYATNLAIVREMNVPTGRDIVIVRGYTDYKSSDIGKTKPQGYADSLSVSGAAGMLEMPIFLAPQKALTEEQIALIKEINPKHIYIIGGYSAVSYKVQEQILNINPDYYNFRDEEYLPRLCRLAGEDRYETSVMIAEEFGLDRSDTAVVAYGQNFPDGLTGGVLAAKLGAPLLLAESGKISDQQTFIRESAATKVYVLGGTAVLPDETISELIN